MAASSVNPRRRRLYVGIGDPGMIDGIDTERMLVVESVPTEIGAKTTPFDNSRQRLYVYLRRSCGAVCAVA